MRIGIIGSGNIGGTLTRRLRTAGYDVTVANSRGPQSLTQLARETGAAAGTVGEAAGDADVVVVAVPMAAVPALPPAAFRGKVVVDANNYYPARDGRIPEVADKRLTSSEWTAAKLPGARIVKAFNTIHAEHLRDAGRPAGDDRRLALPVAADDRTAKDTVMSLVEDLGFDPVDAGSLADSWRQEPDTPVYGTKLGAPAVRQGLAAAHH